MKALLIEDNEDDALFVKECLASLPGGLPPSWWARDLAAGLETLRTEGADVVLLDLGLPDSRGLPTLDAVLTACPETPVIVLTGHDDEVLGLEAIQRGAQDYLPKGDIDGERMVNAIRYAWERKATQRALEASEQRYRRLNAELEQRVQDRTRELVEAQQDLAHYGRVSLLGELAAGVAHELRQPLTTIRCGAEAALDLLGPAVVDVAEMREILDEIIQENQRASSVIGRLRKLFRKEPPELASVDLNTVLQETLALLHHKVVGHGARIENDLGAGLPPIPGDRVQLVQVFSNLILNALDSMESLAPEERQVSVRTCKADPDWLEIVVRDRGTGIPAEHLECLFDSFFTTKKEGMGMGLSICRSIVQNHRGRIWAANDPDGGAAFHVQLPVKLDPTTSTYRQISQQKTGSA